MKLTKNESLIIKDFLNESQISSTEKKSIKDFLIKKDIDKYFNEEKLQYIIRLIKNDKSFLNSLIQVKETIVDRTGTAGVNGLNGVDGKDGVDGHAGERGLKGSDGSSISWKGTWNQNSLYVKGDVIKYFESVYICKKKNSNEIPTNKIVWELFLAKPKDGLKGPVGSGTGVREVTQICKDTFINTNIDKVITSNIEIASVIEGQVGNILSLIVVDNNGNIITEE